MTVLVAGVEVEALLEARLEESVCSTGMTHMAVFEPTSIRLSCYLSGKVIAYSAGASVHIFHNEITE